MEPAQEKWSLGEPKQGGGSVPPPRHAFGGIVGGESIDSHRKPRQRQRRRIAKRPRGEVAIGLALLRLRRHLIGFFAKVRIVMIVRKVRARR